LKIGVKAGWASLNSFKFGKLLQLYTQSWKKFKSGFFRVHLNLAYGESRELFFKKDGETPKFPFYWQRFPFKFKSCPHQLLLAQEVKDIEIIREWPREMSCKFIMVIPNSCFLDRILRNEYCYAIISFFINLGKY